MPAAAETWTRLHLDLDDLLDPDVPGDLHTNRHHQQDLTYVFTEQHVHVVRVDEHQRDGQGRRQCQQDVSGQPAMRGVDAHLAKYLETLANDVGEVLENLRQVAAGLALNQHRRGEEPHVEDRNAQRLVLERVLERQTEVLFVERLPEFRPDRLLHFVGRHLQTGR